MMCTFEVLVQSKRPDSPANKMKGLKICKGSLAIHLMLNKMAKVINYYFPGLEFFLL